ncbi:hypothetical protein DY000_02039258 [Brassica cretica]|uniref:Uncharacterized protein n=1 Tax=Brassica cretica TaxID=69181 RepID=A0ABQ7BKI5_BRACR|nr:hypothetical protein DY000_02039258 [Brassica cretica]
MPPHLDRNTTRGAHVLRSKLPHFTGMQITVPALIGHPPECDIIFRRSQRKSTTELHHESQPKPLKTIDLEPWIYASKSTSTICDRAKKKKPWNLISRVDWATETDSRNNPEGKPTKERCCQSHHFPGAKAGETGDVNRFPETKDGDNSVEGITASQPNLIITEMEL